MHFFQNFGLEPNILYHQLHLTGESFPSHFHRAYEILGVQAGTLALTVEEHTEQLVALSLAIKSIVFKHNRTPSWPS